MKAILNTLAFLAITSTQQVCLADEPTKSIGNIQKEAFTPERILPAGVDSNISTNPYTGESGPARKGIIAATLNNVALLNTLLSEKSSISDSTKVQEISETIISLIPSLRVVGVFDLFTPQEWLSSETQPGRVLAAVLYLQKYPQDITPTIKKRLLQIQNQTKIKVLSESIAKALKGAEQ
ncbi:MAG: hypothetical protein K2P93_03505 [Alphaproteobacteria bacterium]|nr:hypothetical protein [Alphaproteobacteria bacterium]